MTVDERIKELQSMDPDELESMCNHCGLCCCSSIKMGSFNILQKEDPCPYLERQGEESRCSVYQHRFQYATWCLNVFDAIRDGALVNTCPYVKGIKNYHGKRVVEGIETIPVFGLRNV
jgi:uncharacterized cysteine cluster protein YcgN (CxxCxxCC family)